MTPLTFDLTAFSLTRSDLKRMEITHGGRGGYGHDHGVLRQGTGYWTGTLAFERRSRGNVAAVAKMEAMLAEIAGGVKTFWVPMSPQGPPLVSYSAAVEGDITAPTADGALYAEDAAKNPVTIILLPGTRIRVGNRLFMTKFSGPQTVTATPPETIPEWDVAASAVAVLDAPTVAGRMRPPDSASMTRMGSWRGPWTIEWEEAS